MPRRSVLSEFEKSNLLKVPNELSEMSKYYLLSEADISVIMILLRFTRQMEGERF
jgi:hypothetical protein